MTESETLTAQDVRQLRDETGLSQPKFADVVGVNSKTIRNWENGATIPPAMNLLLLGIRAAVVDGRLHTWAAGIRLRVKAAANG